MGCLSSISLPMTRRMEKIIRVRVNMERVLFPRWRLETWALFHVIAI
jgi:hypothetical protein